ncbi:SDR family oxidoreductase [Nonomuraea terrae]|uniref:SDR family oxidoreductase n=1 Tax=Nonomuraea terrae TaxID=2530383 RepID=UPI0037A464AC
MREVVVTGGGIGYTIAAKGTGSGSYGAVRAALKSWSADLAADLAAGLGPRGVTANVVSPGLVPDTDFFRGEDDRRGRPAAPGRHPRRPARHPSDVADTVLFLASAGAGHITGQVLHVNGGAYLSR